MSMVGKLLADRRFHRLALVGLALGAGALLLAWKLGFDMETAKSAWARIEDFLREHPWCLFAGLVVLPGFPVPTSAILLIVGTVWGERPFMACCISMAAITLNMTWTYWLAARPGRGLVERWLATGAVRIPELPKDNHLRMLLILRLTPGIPFFLQNYLLGFLRVPFRLYLPLSVACNALFTVGFILSAAGIAGGSLKPLISGVGLIVVGVVVVQMIRQRLKSGGGVPESPDF